MPFNQRIECIGRIPPFLQQSIFQSPDVISDDLILLPGSLNAEIIAEAFRYSKVGDLSLADPVKLKIEAGQE
ncbi:hypothetical protein D3C73_1384540 [compost metagenome]